MTEIFVGIVLITGFIFWTWWQMHTTSNGAPYEGMDPSVVERVMKIAEVDKRDIFYDLGSGDGRVVISAALKGADAIGIELDKLRALYSKLWIKILGLSKKVQIKNQDIFTTDISNATIVCTYLLPEAHEKLKEKLLKELKPGTKIVAVGFEYKGWKHIKMDPRGGNYGPILLYKV